MRDTERAITQGESRVAAAMGRIGASIRVGIAGALASISVGKLNEFADAFTRTQNQLKAGGLVGEQVGQTYEKLLAIAQAQGAPMEQLATLYSRMSSAQTQLNTSSAEMLTFTNSVATALRLSGAEAGAAQNALVQLGQALSSGTVQWEELESVSDTARPILQAAADGIKEAGGNVGTFISLVREGRVSSEAFYRGILAGSRSMEKLASTTQETSDQALNRLNNALGDLFGKLNDASGAGRGAQAAINAFAGAVQSLSGILPRAVANLREYIGNLEAARRGRDAFAEDLGAAATTKSPPASPSTSKPATFDERYNVGVVPNADAMKGLKKELEAYAKKRYAGIISLDDFKPPGKIGAGKKGKGGAGGGPKADKVDEYEREIEAIGKRGRAFDNERESLGKSAFEIAKAEAAFQLLEAAGQANIPVTDALRAKVDTLATAYANAKVALDEAEERQRKFEAASRQAGATLSDGFKDAILNGEKLTVVIDRLINSLASHGIDSIFDTLFGKGGAGASLLSSMIGGGGADSPTGGVSLFGFEGGGYTGNGGRKAPAGVVHGREFVFDADATRRLGPGNLEALRKGRGLPGYERGGYVGSAPLVPTSPGRINAPRQRSGSVRFSNSPTYNITPAQGVSMAQLRVFFDAHDRELNRTFGQRLSNWKLDN